MQRSPNYGKGRTRPSHLRVLFLVGVESLACGAFRLTVEGPGRPPVSFIVDDQESGILQVALLKEGAWHLAGDAGIVQRRWRSVTDADLADEVKSRCQADASKIS